MLRHCEFCELRCGVDRTQGEPCPCHLGAETYEYKRYVSLNEEPELVPAMRVFFSGCNFRCTFCDEGPGCFEPDRGARIEPSQWAPDLRGDLPRDVQCISFLGGEPTLHVHTLLAIAEALNGTIPLAVNTNLYMTPEVLAWLDDVVTYYLADFKFGNDCCAKRIAGVPRYMEVVCRNLLLLGPSPGLIVRHVLIPGHLDCCYRPIVDWLCRHLPAARFELYTSYVPCWKASRDPTTARLNTPSEIERAEDFLEGTTLRWRTHKLASSAAPNVLKAVPVEVSLTIGADGRVYCHDLTPELASLLTTVTAPAVPGSARTE